MQTTLPQILENLAGNESRSVWSTYKGGRRNGDGISVKSFSTVSRREIKQRANLDPNLFDDPSDMVSIVSGLESEPDEFYAIEKLNVLRDFEDRLKAKEDLLQAKLNMKAELDR